MLEPIHGSAFDIVGKGIANPLGAFWTGAMMLEHLGEGPAAARLMAATEKVTASGPRTPDLGGQAARPDAPRAVLAPLERRPAGVRHRRAAQRPPPRRGAYLHTTTAI